MQLTLYVATITMSTLFHQCLAVKPCFEMKFCQKVLFFCYVKSCGSKYNFCDLLWLTENLGVISTIENIKSTGMDNLP